MVVAQQLVEEIDRFVRDKTLVLGCHKTVPRLLLESAQYIIVLRIQLNLVLVEIVEQVVGSQDLGNFDQLVRVAVTVEERLFAEDHRCKHGPQAPHVQAVVVLLEVNKEFWTLEVAGCHPDVVLCSRVVELGKTPVDET